MTVPLLTDRAFLEKLLERFDRVGKEEIRTYLLRIAREKEFLETVFNTLQEGIAILDLDGRITFGNEGLGRLLGFNPAQALGEPIAKYARQMPWQEWLRAEHLVTRDVQIDYPELRYLTVTIIPLEQGREDPLFVAILRDATAAHEQTQETIENERLNALTLLAAGVAHELGNPLNSINIHLQLIERELRRLDDALPPRTRDSLHIIQSEIQRLDQIIHHFLKAVRPAPVELKLDQLNSVVIETLHILMPELRDKDLLVEQELDHDLPLIRLDRDRLKQALFNLVQNAAQAMTPGGLLHVRTGCDESHVHLTLSDTGCGIDPVNLQRIFDPYFTTKPSGSGLGLLIVRRIVQEHLGQVQIESTPGRGTTVRLFFPRPERQVKLLASHE